MHKLLATVDCSVLIRLLQVTDLYNAALSMCDGEGNSLERLGDTWIITGDIFCNQHTNIAARSAAGCAIQVC